MSKTIMILGASYDQIPMIEKANEKELKVISIDGNREAPGFAIADEHHCVEVMDSEKVLEIARQKKIDGITTMVSNLGMRTVAYVASQMNLPAIPVESAKAATDKVEIKKILQKGHVPVPKGISCRHYEEAKEKINELDFPVIVKPVDGTKGRGLVMVENEKILKKNINYSLTFSPSKRLIIEEWIDGPTVGAECLIVDGELEPILLTDKYNTKPPECVTLGLTTPSDLPEVVQEKVIETAKGVAKALGLNTGAAHIDMVVDKGRPKVIDVGPRLASGPVIFDFAPNIMGVDMIGAIIDMALGETPVIRKRWNGKYGAERFLPPSDKGCMYTINFPKVNRKFAYYPYKELGVPVNRPKSDNDRIGCFSIVADSYKEAVEEADSLLQRIHVDIAN
ncbi:MAG: ATP-grasp domain-containing protein [Candidatus Aminicenantes bacterium]